ncbi:TIGR02281 family clan AA aspartic protease [Massilia sp. W12]|uniref:TIGR02281 family clan AA aspartic protease n=1 Tax=Massilia sp. W12 TaxID=3126507 RepID=UPI0030CB4C8B
MRTSLSTLCSVLLLSLAAHCNALEIGLAGIFPGKALLVVDGAPPKLYDVGAKLGEQARLVSVERDSVQIEINGKRRTFRMGEHVRSSGIDSGEANSSGVRQKVVLPVGSGGHVYTNVQVNGVSVRMVLDTGATLIALPARDAQRIGLDYRKGRLIQMNTANGANQAYLVKLDSVKIGDLSINAVDASVLESGLDQALLGMSFLNRTNMVRENDKITLEKRF